MKNDDELTLVRAAEQLKEGLHNTSIECLVDDFFVNNLPTEVFRRRRSRNILGSMHMIDPIESGRKIQQMAEGIQTGTGFEQQQNE
jgi:hypothetical protein